MSGVTTLNDDASESVVTVQRLGGIMRQRIGDLQSEDKIHVQFVYRDGDPGKLASKQVDS